MRPAFRPIVLRPPRKRRLSSVYESEPMEALDRPWFLNLVAEARTELFSRQLLARVARIEQALGLRVATKGTRHIDIDILLYGNFIVRTPELVIPHECFVQRRFVLAPAAELAPDLRDPVRRKSMRELPGAVTGQALRQVAFRPVTPGESRE